MDLIMMERNIQFLRRMGTINYLAAFLCLGGAAVSFVCLKVYRQVRLERGMFLMIAAGILGMAVISTRAQSDMENHISIECQTNPVYQRKHQIFFKDRPTCVIKVNGRHFNPDTMKISLTGQKAGGNPISSKNLSTIDWTVHEDNNHVHAEGVITFRQEGRYRIHVSLPIDDSVQEMTADQEIIYDHSAPVINCDRHANQGDLIFSNGRNVGNYQECQYFSKKRVATRMLAHDSYSGVRTIQWEYLDQNDRLIAQGEKEGSVDGSEDSELRAVSQAPEGDFTGKIRVTAIDYCGNVSKTVISSTFLQEMPKTHESRARLKVNLSGADRKDSAEKKAYYKKVPKIHILAADSDSGIRRITVTAGKESREISYDGRQNILYEAKEDMVLPFPEGGDLGENISVKVTLEDNAGNETVKDLDGWTVVIDERKPEVSVSYPQDCQKRNGYYLGKRTALVTVTDHDFNPSESVIHVSGPKSSVKIGRWQGKGDQYTAQVHFLGDGDGFQIEVLARDHLGNQTVWKEKNPFSIDMTPPRLSISMNRDGVSHGYYYRSGRVVTLHVTESHFSKKGVHSKILVRRHGKQKSQIPSGNFVKEGDEYQMQIPIDEDGEYEITFSCQDQAGNRGEKAKPLHFILDKTKPDISVRHLESGAVLSGEVIPEVEISDENLDASTVRYQIRRSGGSELTREEYPAVLTKDKGKIRIHWNNLSKTRDHDGWYVLTGSVQDMAGNMTSLGGGIPFAVDRHGAVMSLDQTTQGYQKNAYLKEEPELAMKISSVSSCQLKVIVLRDHQERAYLEEGRDYDIKSCSPESEDRQGWQQKKITIHKEVFSEDGAYQLLVFAREYGKKDGATVPIIESRNDEQGDKILFTIDKTSPEIQLFGVEKGVYEEKKHQFSVRALDNQAIKFVDVTIHRPGSGQEDQTYHFTPKDFDQYHKVMGTIKEYPGYQEISYVAEDMAGNETSSVQKGQKVQCVVSSDRLKIFAYSKLAMGLVIACLLLSIIIKVAFDRDKSV